jgi:hypothetical protein
MDICLDCAIHFTRSGALDSGNYGYLDTAFFTSFSKWENRKISLKPASGATLKVITKLEP